LQALDLRYDSPVTRFSSSGHITMTLLGVYAIASGMAGAAAPAVAPASAPASAAPAAPSATPAAALAAPMSGEQVMQFLDHTVNWYRTLGVQQQVANEASDMLILYENRQITTQVVSLAFEAARANADLLAKQPAPPAAGGGAAAAPSQPLAQRLKQLDAQVLSIQNEMDSTKRGLAAAPGKTRTQLQAKVAELQGELDLINAKKSIITSIGGFQSTGAGSSNSTTLRAQIDAVAVALPSVNAAPSAGGGSATASGHTAASAATGPLPAAASTSSDTLRFGLWDLIATVFRLSEKMSTIDTVNRRTADLKEEVGGIRDRIIAQMRALSGQGDALMAQADAADSATLGGVRDQLDSLVSQLKEASTIFIPLSKEVLLLDQYQHNLDNWHEAVKTQSRDAMKALAVRLAVLLIILAGVFVLADLWRRAVLRYIVDARRRYQMMLLRRIALWSLVAAIVGFAFASELSSIVTFAGLITAGLAVAMQSVLVSIVGYFFLIGKYGISVGDRVQIGEVNGEIIDIGLVRMYLMEFAGRGSVAPTGRVVAFPNSVVFQVSSGLFKQIPGVNFTWHDITLSVPAGVDYASTKEQLYKAAVGALADYREDIEQQTQAMQRTTLSSAGGKALPTVQLSYSAKGVDAHVRYPVQLAHAAETDERMSKALLQVISGLAPSGPAEPSS
jgi:small-conductance mechanosensitive channel